MTSRSELWVQNNYYIKSHRNGLSILQNQHPKLWRDTIFALRWFRLYYHEIVSPGGGKSQITQRLEKFFTKKGWQPVETQETTNVRIGKNFGKPSQTIYKDYNIVSKTHEIDLLKGKIAIEIEWNNKHQFFSRDLEAFDYLYRAGVIDAGIIITKHTSLHELFKSLGYLISTTKAVASKYGSSHTHTDKLENLLASNRCSCPIVVIGLTENIFRF
ncbi:hypothetical protein COM81_27575 [Priestia megaterium]|uniref:BglII/BstYI family type II restriction endonuclease n=1 Tax=Priestia megaterium TaxID=1404 RepID=UPI000BEBEAFC|nr:BglII/BstYI family type II restriction endonuclease [Priestia megaterium]PEE73679.1 hypothetical protein COM81_27575 [Priestia megaterium]